MLPSGYVCKYNIREAVPKLQLLEQLLTPGENCMSRKCLPYKKPAIFSKSLFQNQPGFGTSSRYIKFFPKFNFRKIRLGFACFIEPKVRNQRFAPTGFWKKPREEIFVLGTSCGFSAYSPQNRYFKMPLAA
jgi:hypothetical protein